MLDNIKMDKIIDNTIKPLENYSKDCIIFNKETKELVAIIPLDNREDFVLKNELDFEIRNSNEFNIIDIDGKLFIND